MFLTFIWGYVPILEWYAYYWELGRPFKNEHHDAMIGAQQPFTIDRKQSLKWTFIVIKLDTDSE